MMCSACHKDATVACWKAPVTCEDASSALRKDVLERRQAESERFARSGGGDAHQVAASLQDGPALRLYRRGRHEAARRVQQLR